jgi:hypothetical protein
MITNAYFNQIQTVYIFTLVNASKTLQLTPLGTRFIAVPAIKHFLQGLA